MSGEPVPREPDGVVPRPLVVASEWAWRSLVVAAAVLAGVIANNRTHREGIAAADERGRQALDAAQRNVELSNMVGDQRDHEAWRREAVLAAVASILETSASVRAA